MFCLTDTGRSEFYQAYDVLAIRALEYLREHGGEQAVVEFAGHTMDLVAARFSEADDADVQAVEVLADALNAEGYVASVEPVASGTQLCQYHCPVAHVASAFPELCEAETRVFAELLGSHVQRIATIAHGDGVCTTHVPHPVDRKVSR